MSFGVHPVILIAVAGVIAALVAIVIACRAQSGFVTGLMLVLAVLFIAPAGYVFLAFHPELVDGRFRTYKAFYRDIDVGMTREQVFSAMERRYPKDGPRKRPKVMSDEFDDLGFFMNPESSREPNCEGIFLKLEAGRVVSKDYSPD
jgi:hypothetical protein